eukprot:GHVS01010227.1.p1 GENE.GHVS01010227.1~~GHVS01010227.1.p1  ORF type:complete len:269 (+),score=72.02 GHVS01010227.1:30-836(+)
MNGFAQTSQTAEAAKPKFSFGIKRKPTPSAPRVEAPGGVGGFRSEDGGRVFEEEGKAEDRREQLLSITSSGGMETTGGVSRNRVIVCKKKLPPRDEIRPRGRGEEDEERTSVKKEVKEDIVVRVKTEPVEHAKDEHPLEEKKAGGLVGVSRPILSEPGWGLQVKGEQKDTEDCEVEMFRRQLRNYPTMSRHAYDRMPVEEFGLAMLRGMGYVPEEEGGGGRQWSKPYVLEKRAYARAGLGADDKVLLPTEKAGKLDESGNSSGKRPIK